MNEKSIRGSLAQIYNSGCCDKCGGELVHFDVGDVQCQECGRTGDDIERDLRAAHRAEVDHDSRCGSIDRSHSWSYGEDDTGAQTCLHYGAVTIPEQWTPRCPRCGDDQQQDDEGNWSCPCGSIKPRAVVAISEDRRWLVVLAPNGEWQRYHWEGDGTTFPGWRAKGSRRLEDTGQDANEVLASFLEGRG